MDFWRQMSKKEIYLYSGIYDFVAQEVIQAMEENSGEDITMRVNSPGGNVFAGWGIIAKMQEREGKVNIKVDGAAFSMTAFMLLFADNVEALDVSTFMFHRANMYVSTPEDQVFLDKVNAGLRKKMEAKIDTAKLKELTGTSIKDLFEAENRIDLVLDAKQMKALGIVNKITKLTPAEATAFNEKMYAVAATSEENPTNENQNKNTMTKEDFKLKHPDAYAAIVKESVDAERDRVGAWMAFSKADPEAVAKGIKEGKNLSQTEMAELSVKMLSANALDKIAGESAEAVVTAEVKDKKDDKGKTEAQKKDEAFEKSIDAMLNIKQPA